MSRLAGARAVKGDVSKYQKMDTGTAGAPQKQSSKVADTRVKSGGVSSSAVKGTGSPSHSKMRMKKNRMTSESTSKS